MLFILLVFLFLVGTSLGSFINAFEHRLRNNIDFVSARSHCPKCKKTLQALDLIPLLSFLFLKGKCRYCRAPIAWQYPVIEILSGMLFVIGGLYTSTLLGLNSIENALSSLGLSLVIGLCTSLFLFFALYDFKYFIIPNKVVLPSIGLFVLFNLILVGLNLLNIYIEILEALKFSPFDNFTAAFGGATLIFLIIFITKGKGMGGGDLKLVFLMGLILGIYKLIIALYFAVILGAILGLIWGIKEKRIKGVKIPFGVFLSVGTIVALFWGDVVIEVVRRELFWGVV